MTCQVSPLEVAHAHFAHELVIGRKFCLKKKSKILTLSKWLLYVMKR